MLERATACLKAGARDVPNRAHQASRSKRRLHSTFWTHGAGDLELPPWVVSMPSGPPPNPDSTSLKRGERRRDGTDTASAVNDTFLDFLYPPQALAWLHHSQTQRWAQWESRNIRRLPKGYVPASRRYASSSYAQPTPVETQVQQKKEEAATPIIEREEPRDAVSSKRTDSLGLEAAAITGPLGQKSRRASRSEAYQRSLQMQSTSARQLGEGAIPLFGDSPADMADIQSHLDGTDVDGLHGLRRLLQSGRRSTLRDEVGQAWRVYMALAEDEKQDVRLKREMLAWLVKQESKTADAHCISIYWSIPPAARELAVYKAATTAFLRRRDFPAIFGLHREALSNIPNGSQITKDLFSYSLRRRRWSMALHVKEQLDEAFVEPAASRQQAIFWFDVAEQPQLLETTADFVSWCLKKQSQGQIEPKLIRLALRLSEESLNQFLEQPLPVPKRPGNTAHPIRNVRSVLRGISKWSPRAQSIFEAAIMATLRRHESKDEYARAHLLTQLLYTGYRKFPNVRPPEDMLMLLLERLKLHSRSKPNPNVASDDVLSIGMVARDWQTHHERLSKPALYLLLGHHASSGDAQQVEEYFDYLRRQFPDYADQKSAFWYPIYVHARLSDSQRALRAFQEVEKIAAKEGEQLESKCWSTLLHAYSRAHDMDGAFATFRKMINSGIRPDQFHVHPLTELLASTGDVEGVDDLLQQYDSLSDEPRSTSLAGSQMHAAFNVGDLQRAEEILKQTVSDVRARKVTGSLTGCFNILITSYALKRDVDATMRVYRWMTSEKILMNEFTYSALMQALIHFRQTDAAKMIMLKVMPREGFEPTALHYAIVMVGYNKERLFSHALDVHAKMKENNVRETLASRRAYLQAKAWYEQKASNPTTADGQPAPLKEVIAELRAAVDSSEGFEIAAKQPMFGYDSTEQFSGYLDHMMYIHSSRRCLEAVEEMFETVQKSSDSALFAPTTPTLRLLTAFMQALYHAKRYDEVEAFWKVAKQQADKIAAPPRLPDFTATKDDGADAVEPTQDDPIGQDVHVDVDRAEIGFESNSKLVETAPSVPVAKRDAATVVRPARGRRYILLGPLRQYLAALARQNRIGELVTTCTRLLQQGYAFDIVVWNRFIQHICTSSPSLVLLAFTLTERYMISKFPGWKKHTHFKPQRSSRDQNLQYIKARYLPREQVMPQYRTMLHLASALLKLKRSETVRGRNSRREQGGLHRLVGTVAQIQERAPKTLAAVENMPNVDDKWQRILLRPQR